MSILMAGAGQFTKGDTIKGLIFFSLCLLTLALATWNLIFLLILVMIWVYNIWDAYSS
ncbi:MAG: hypothetical protein IH946_01575 [Bacteroidetes bacterium]|nr:hypothetical protein [Bacteroidota bacterium]